MVYEKFYADISGCWVVFFFLQPKRVMSALWTMSKFTQYRT